MLSYHTIKISANISKQIKFKLLMCCNCDTAVPFSNGKTQLLFLMYFSFINNDLTVRKLHSWAFCGFLPAVNKFPQGQFNKRFGMCVVDVAKDVYSNNSLAHICCS